jgi:hypothetical protein
VTDLFKVWKTRIWLSAVNPETYPAPPRRPGDQSRQPRRGGHHDSRKDQSLHAASAARRAYIRGAQDLATGQFPAAMAATFNQSGQPAQGAFSPPGRVILPQGPGAFSNRQPNTLTFGSMPPGPNQFGGPGFNNAPTANGMFLVYLVLSLFLTSNPRLLPFWPRARPILLQRPTFDVVGIYYDIPFATQCRVGSGRSC